MEDRKFLEQLLWAKKMELEETINQKRVSIESYDVKIACTRNLIDLIEKQIGSDHK